MTSMRHLSKFRRIALSVLGAVALVAVGSGVTLAAVGSTGPDSAFVYACYNNKTHVMHYATAGATCPAGQTGLYPSVGGQLTTVRTPNASGASTEAVAVCPASNPYVISGAADLSGAGGNGEAVYAEGPLYTSTGEGWKVDVGGLNGSTSPYVFTALAICSR